MWFYDLNEAFENGKEVHFGEDVKDLDLCVGETLFWIDLDKYGQMNLKPVKGKPDHYKLESRDIRRKFDPDTDYLKMFKNGTEVKIMQTSSLLIIDSNMLNRTYIYLDSLGSLDYPPMVCSA